MVLVQVSTNFDKSGDYSMRAGGGGEGTYEFNGNNYLLELIMVHQH